MAEIPRSANLLKDMIISTPELFDPKLKPEEREERLAKMADAATKKLPPPAYIVDEVVYRIVVISLGLVAVIAVFGALFLGTLQIFGEVVEVPDLMTALGAGAIGALAGMLAPSPVNR